MANADRFEREPNLIELYSEAEVSARIWTMAQDVRDMYADSDPIFVAFLNGALPFASQLMTQITRQDPNFHPVLDCMIVSTYKDGMKAGKPRIVTDLAPTTHIVGRRIVMLDDLIDTGTTASFMDGVFRFRGAEEVDMVTLVQKQNPDSLYPDIMLYGFDAPKDAWLTGMGMDNAPYKREANRWMTSIAIVEPLDEQTTET